MKTAHMRHAEPCAHALPRAKLWLEKAGQPSGFVQGDVLGELVLYRSDASSHVIEAAMQRSVQLWSPSPRNQLTAGA